MYITLLGLRGVVLGGDFFVELLVLPGQCVSSSLDRSLHMLVLDLLFYLLLLLGCLRFRVRLMLNRLGLRCGLFGGGELRQGHRSVLVSQVPSPT